MKTCPYCSEEIQGAAIKCRYCGEWLTHDERVSAQPSQDDVPVQIVNTSKEPETDAATRSELLTSEHGTRITSINSAVKWKERGLRHSKTLGTVAVLLVSLSVIVVIRIWERPTLTDQDLSKLSDSYPYLSKDDIALLMNEIIKRRLDPEQAGRFSFDTFQRGVKLLQPNEQEEIDGIREQLFSSLSDDETSKWNSLSAKAQRSQLTKEELENATQLQKKAINNLPESARSRFQFLMGKALRAGLNTK